LADWEELQQATHTIIQAQPSPALTALEGIWARIDVWEDERTQRGKAGQMLLHLWLICQRQVSLLHKGIWLVSLLLTSLACTIAVFLPRTLPEQTYLARWILALCIVAGTAIGAACIERADNATSVELTLTTYTSLRVVMLCRILLLIGYNLTLATLASLVLASIQHAILWDSMQLWLGPMLLLSAVSILLSLLVSTKLALAGSLLIEVTQALPIFLSQNSFVTQLTQSGFWQTNPLLALLALLLIALSIYAIPFRYHR
jgi:hypothetical protein